MTIADICSLAGDITARNFNTSSSNLITDSPDDTASDSQLFAYCACFAVSEVTSLYCPQKDKIQIGFDNGTLLYETLDFANSQNPLDAYNIRRVREIVKVELDGENLHFSTLNNGIYCPDAHSQAVTVYYLYSLNPSIISYFPLPLSPNITAELLAYGALTEYFFRKGQTDEGLFFRSRFDFALQNAKRANRRTRIKPYNLL